MAPMAPQPIRQATGFGPSPVVLTAVMCAAQVFSLQGIFTFSALLPTFIDEWRLSNTDAGWISGVYFGGYVVAVAILVSLTDRIEAKYVHMASAAVTTISALCFALFAEGFWTAIVFRTLGGIGLAGTYMPGTKLLSDRIAGQGLSRATAFYTSSFGIGAALSYLFAGIIAAWLDWRWSFGGAAVAGVMALAIVALMVPDGPLRREGAPESHLLDFRPVLRNPRTMGYVACYCTHNYELFAVRSWIVAFMVYAQSLQPDSGAGWSATVIATAVTLIGMPCSVIGNELSLRFGRHRVIVAIMGTSAAVACVIGFTAPLPMAAVVLLVAAYYTVVNGDSASIIAGALLSAPADLKGATMAVFSSLGFLGAFLGPIGFGAVLDLAGGDGFAAWGLAFASSGLVLILGPVILVWLARGDRGADEHRHEQ